jgi:SPX domain protein involved in polyphosphate accumulation
MDGNCTRGMTVSGVFFLGQDDSGTANTDAKQDFVRNTKKYWVPTEHISSLKHLVLQHLPVFRQGDEGDEL